MAVVLPTAPSNLAVFVLSDVAAPAAMAAPTFFAAPAAVDVFVSAAPAVVLVPIVAATVKVASIDSVSAATVAPTVCLTTSSVPGFFLRGILQWRSCCSFRILLTNSFRLTGTRRGLPDFSCSTAPFDVGGCGCDDGFFPGHHRTNSGSGGLLQGKYCSAAHVSVSGMSIKLLKDKASGG